MDAQKQFLNASSYMNPQSSFQGPIPNTNPSYLSSTFNNANNFGASSTMGADNVPPQLIYNKLQTRSFLSQFREWSIQPIASSGYFWPGQIIRIYLNAFNSGVMDPYRSHLQITVSTNSDLLPVGLLQVDNSAQSFIQQMIIQSKSRQIQRITQYSVLAAYLTDIGLSQLYAQGRQTQGLGYTNLNSFPSGYAAQSNVNSGQFSSLNFTGSNATSFGAPCNSFPTIPSKYPYANLAMNQHTPNNITANNLKGHFNPINGVWINPPQVAWYNFLIDRNDWGSSTIQASVATYGYAYNIRAQYLFAQNSIKYTDSTSSFSNFQVHLDPDVFASGIHPRYQKNKTIYRTYIPETIPYAYTAPKNQALVWADNMWGSIPNVCSIQGFSNLFSPLFSKGTNEPFISPTVPQLQIYQGRILKQKIPVSERTFKIPLISAIIGLLIPQQQFILIPLLALNDMLIQLTIDQFAMFTSGYNDISQYDNIGMASQQQRAFQIKRVSYRMHTYQFFNPQIDQYLKLSLQNGIAINCQYWQLSNQYQIQNSQSLTNAWSIACTQQALNQVVVLFYALDYNIYSFCRKHFRISNNITKFQLRMNMQYFPPQPYLGNGGNPIDSNPFGDNSTFLQNIYFSNGYMFSNLTPSPRINAYNFAINQRCYSPSNNNWLNDSAMQTQKVAYTWNQNSINYDTAMGMSFIHENRFVGKAAYVYSFQPYAHSADFLVGVNCKLTKNFDIILTSSPQNWFPRGQMMYVFTRSSNIIQYSQNGVINVNK